MYYLLKITLNFNALNFVPTPRKLDAQLFGSHTPAEKSCTITVIVTCDFPLPIISESSVS